MHAFLGVIDSVSGSATADEGAAIDAFNAELKRRGHWVLAGGIAAPGDSTIVDARSEPAMTTPGALNEADEFIAGFWIIETPSLDAAQHVAIAASRACNRRVELRTLLGLAD